MWSCDVKWSSPQRSGASTQTDICCRSVVHVSSYWRLLHCLVWSEHPDRYLLQGSGACLLILAATALLGVERAPRQISAAGQWCKPSHTGGYCTAWCGASTQTDICCRSVVHVSSYWRLLPCMVLAWKYSSFDKDQILCNGNCVFFVHI